MTPQPPPPPAVAEWMRAAARAIAIWFGEDPDECAPRVSEIIRRRAQMPTPFQSELAQARAVIEAQAANLDAARTALRKIMEMAENDLRHGWADEYSLVWQIEADARAELEGVSAADLAPETKESP